MFFKKAGFRGFDPKILLNLMMLMHYLDLLLYWFLILMIS